MFRNGAKVGFFNLLENLTITFFQKQIFSFFQKIQLSFTTSDEFLAPSQNLQKSNDTIPENTRTNKWRDIWMD